MRVVAAVVMALLVSSAPALADEREDRANELVEEGNTLGAAGKLEEAIAKFNEAEKLLPRALHDCNIGLAYVRLEKWSRAHNFLLRCSHRWPASDGARPDWIASNLGGIEAQLAAGPYAQLQVSSIPAGGDVYVDGEKLFESTIWLEVGTHRVKVVKEGFIASEQPVTLARGVNKQLVVSLARVVAASPPAPTAVPAQPTVAAPAPATTVTRERPRSSNHYLLAAGTTASVLGAGLVVAGVVFRSRANDARSDLQSLNAAAQTAAAMGAPLPLNFDRDFADGEDKIARNNLLMGTSFVTAGILAGAGGYLLYRALTGQDNVEASVSLDIGAGRGGAVARWSF